MKEKDICSNMGNIIQTHDARLYNIGRKRIKKKDEYRNIIQDYLAKAAS